MLLQRELCLGHGVCLGELLLVAGGILAATAEYRCRKDPVVEDLQEWYRGKSRSASEVSKTRDAILARGASAAGVSTVAIYMAQIVARSGTEEIDGVTRDIDVVTLGKHTCDM